ncbi:MAG: FAD:protein FMN transferase, partial [Pirellulaceae bacterium]|nr:FAD:protein FMN transferase [Pirellulaceae bacterium]
MFLTLAACRPASRDVGQTELRGRTMGTTYTVKLVPPVRDATTAEAIHEAVKDELDAVDSRMSTYRDDSELSRFNASSSTDWFAVSSETAQVVHEAIEIGRISGGALDVTIEPLVRLWNFGPGASENEGVPSDDQIEEARRSTGLHLLDARLDPPAIRKDRPEVHVDLSSIAKGYAVDRVADLLDRVADLLDRRGHDNYMVEVGGEVRSRGLNRQGRPWQIAIERPIGGAREIQSVLPLGTRAMATSGDYRNYFEKDGRRYSHLIDPRTGRPIAHGLVSATVLAD